MAPAERPDRRVLHAIPPAGNSRRPFRSLLVLVPLSIVLVGAIVAIPWPTLRVQLEVQWLDRDNGAAHSATSPLAVTSKAARIESGGVDSASPRLSAHASTAATVSPPTRRKALVEPSSASCPVCTCAACDGGSDAASGTTDGPLFENYALRAHPMSVKIFAVASAYRTGENSFTVVGESVINAQLHFEGNIVDECIWEGANGQREFAHAEPLHLSANNHNNNPWGTVIINCTFNSSIGSDNKGGLLSLRKHTDMRRYHSEAPLPEVSLLGDNPVHVDASEMAVMVEKAGGFALLRAPLRFTLAYCSGPLFDLIQPRPLGDWIEYHVRVVGVEHLFVYDHGGLETVNGTMAVMQSYVSKGLATLNRMRGWGHFRAHYMHQITHQNDCLYRNRFLSKWVLFTDMDEYVYVPPPATLLSALSSLTNEIFASMGSYICDIHTCSKQHGEDEQAMGEPLVRHLPWRQAMPSCTNNALSPLVCPKSAGRRKLVVNPRRVVRMSIHAVDEKVEPVGINWNAPFALPTPKLLHFQGIVRLWWKHRCLDEPKDKSLIHDDTFVKFVEKELK